MLLLLPARSHAIQVTNTDSLRKVLAQTTPNDQSFEQYTSLLKKLGTEEKAAADLVGDWLLQHTRKQRSPRYELETCFQLGRINTYSADFEAAALFFVQARHLAVTTGNRQMEAQAINGLGVMHQHNRQPDTARAYYEQALAISRSIGFTRGIAIASYNIGNQLMNSTHVPPETLRTALQYMQQGLAAVTELRDTPSIINQANGVAEAHTLLQQYDSALLLLKHSEQLVQLTGKTNGYLRVWFLTAQVHEARKEYAQALAYFNKGLQLGKSTNNPGMYFQYYRAIAGVLEKTGRYQEAYRNFDTFFKLHDSLVTKENYQSVSVIQSKYEQSRKDNELLALAAANNRKTLVNKLFAASAVALLVIGLLGYRNFRNRGKIARQQHELQQQKITELEKDKQLLTIDAMLKGQEEERSRIAKDLHDGLGGLLSGTRISFQQVKENLVFTPENLRLFERSMGMLDHTITDLRKVAHNLMPEALARFGLYEAVHDFCNSIRASSGIETTYQLVGEQRKYSDTAAVFIYRIIQELVNNAIKHASASHVMVQLSTGEATTGITVEDNGRGFNKEILLQSRGAGMANIQYRVAYFNGTIDIISEPGSGTSVNIHLKT